MEMKTPEEAQKEYESSKRFFEEKQKKPEELSESQRKEWKAAAKKRFDNIWEGKIS